MAGSGSGLRLGSGDGGGDLRPGLRLNRISDLGSG